jgi:protein SCO1/2
MAMSAIETETEPKPKAGAFLWGLLALLAFGVGLMLYSGGTKVEPAYANAFGGPFALVDPQGKIVTDETLKGKPFAIFFGFTRCPDVCPTTLGHMARYRKELGKDADKLNIVFVSVDPGHDKPADIGAYLNLFDMPVIGLTGNDAQLSQAVKAYKVFYEKVPIAGDDYTIDHTATVFLMTAEGKFESAISYNENPKTALEKLKRLVSG